MNRTPPSDPSQVALRTLLAQVRAYIEYQQSSGVEAFPRTTGSVFPVAVSPVAGSGHAVPVQASASQAAPSPGTPQSAPPHTATHVAPVATDLFVLPGVQQAGTLGALREEIGDCRRCKLWSGRTHIVFGVGNPQARLMFVGEGPGRDEDLQAEPFVGRAGQLLTEIITKGMKMRREDVYIANVIKCRPPQNRNPEPDEIAACQPFLLRQIELIRPQVLVALGTFAAQTLLGSRVPISRLRGHWYDYHGVKLMPTLHPAYLLRNPNDKKLVWADIKMVLSELER
ncbi:MAG: phage polymerase-related protein [Deltaproteobacteria bacterium]|nr:phage polymerase-related protein [Deltaproteobacteria bacterium]